jgi:NAD(P)H-quinone oxidoreductase subunit 4
VPIIAIGLYPRLVTDTYRASVEALVNREEQAMAFIKPLAATARLRGPHAFQAMAALKAPALTQAAT